MGSRGTNLRISRNLNQPVNGVRPFPRYRRRARSARARTLGTITQVESTGFSNYHAFSAGATKRLSLGLSFDTSYTWSKSLDTNSLNSNNFNVQDGYDIPNQYGLSDFDARHRFMLSATYQLPFNGSAWTRGWQISTIVQSQSGNPVNIVTSNATLNGVPNSVRPDLVAPIRIIGSVDQWFDPASFAAVDGFGNLGPQRRGRSVVPQHRSVGEQGDDRREPLSPAAPRRCFRSVQPSELRPAWQRRRQSDLRQDLANPPAHRRSRFVAPDSTGGESVVLMGLRCRALRCSWLQPRPRMCHGARPAARSRRLKIVLIISGGPEAYPGNSDTSMRSLRKTLFSHPTMEIDDHSEYLENEEFGEAADASLRGLHPHEVRDRRPDAVIANAAPALQFVLHYRDTLFPNVPVVFDLNGAARRIAGGQTHRHHRRLRGQVTGRNPGVDAEAAPGNQARARDCVCPGN